MEVVNATNARQNLYKLIHQTNETHIPIQILGKNGNAVLISEDDWRALEETLYLKSIPGMAESIIEGMNLPASELVEDIGWDIN